MKFQNPNLIFFFERTDGRTDKPKPICSPLFQSWGHNYTTCHIVRKKQATLPGNAVNYLIEKLV